MEQKEIIELAMEALILKKLEPGVEDKEIAEIDKKLKILADLYTMELFKRN